MAKISGFRVFKIIIKSICIILVFGTIALLLWRIFSSGDPAAMKRLVPNDKLSAAVQAADSEGREIDAFTQTQPTNITTAKHNYNYFTVSNAVFIRDVEQVHLTFRYNNSTLRHLKDDKGLAEIPDRHEDLYDVTLWAVYDLTPDVVGDDENVEYVRYYPTAPLTQADTKNLYNYRKFVFEGVKMTSAEKPLLTIYMDVYYVGDKDYEAEPYGMLPLYQYIYPNEPYTLTDGDRKGLGLS